MKPRNIIMSLLLISVGVYAYRMWQRRNIKTIKEGSFTIEVQQDAKQ